jgi:hypothetical protein
MSDHEQPYTITPASSNRDLYIRYYRKCVAAGNCHTSTNTKICCNLESSVGGAGIFLVTGAARPWGVTDSSTGIKWGGNGEGPTVHSCSGVSSNCTQMHLWTFVGQVTPASNCLYGWCTFQNIVNGSPGVPTDSGTCAAGHTCYEFGDNNGHWYYIEHHIRYNSTGNNDGIYEMWMDDCGIDGLQNGCATGGTLRTRYTGLQFNGSPIAAIWTEQHGGSAPVSEQVGSEYYWDQWAVMSVRVGPMGAAGPDTTPPSPPTGLHILP